MTKIINVDVNKFGNGFIKLKDLMKIIKTQGLDEDNTVLYVTQEYFGENIVLSDDKQQLGEHDFIDIYDTSEVKEITKEELDELYVTNKSLNYSQIDEKYPEIPDCLAELRNERFKNMTEEEEEQWQEFIDNNEFECDITKLQEGVSIIEEGISLDYVEYELKNQEFMVIPLTIEVDDNIDIEMPILNFYNSGGDYDAIMFDDVKVLTDNAVVYKDDDNHYMYVTEKGKATISILVQVYRCCAT